VWQCFLRTNVPFSIRIWRPQARGRSALDHVDGAPDLAPAGSRGDTAGDFKRFP
jgi:hypothetical protein